MPTKANIRIIDEGPGAHSFVELSKQQNGFLGTSVIVVSRPGLSDRLIHNHLIPRAISQNAAIIFPISIPYLRNESILTLGQEEQFKISPNHIYKIEQSTQSDSAENMAFLLSHFRDSTSVNKRHHPIVIVVDTLQKWSESLEVQIRYLIQEASGQNLSVWLHTPIQLIPIDLISTIGNVVIIWPSQNEIKLLSENLPAIDVNFWGKRQSQGLFIYNKVSSTGWQFIEFSPSSTTFEST